MVFATSKKVELAIKIFFISEKNKIFFSNKTKISFFHIVFILPVCHPKLTLNKHLLMSKTNWRLRFD